MTGASPEAWAHWSDTLELRADLLPVVCTPGLPMHPQSKMATYGKTPCRLHAKGVVGIPGWPTHAATAAEVARWASVPDHGICLITRTVRAIDIDIDDPAAAQDVRESIALVLGDLPARTRSGTGRVVLLVRCEGTMPKQVIRTPYGVIELLATGQQVVIEGTHTSGQRYVWADGLPSIPEVSMHELRGVWAMLADAFADPAQAQVGEGSGAVRTQPRTALPMADPVADWLRESGAVRDTTRDGRLFLHCPFLDEHTAGRDDPSSTSYLPPEPDYPRYRIVCKRGACAGRQTEDFMVALGWDESAQVVDQFDIMPVVVGSQPVPLFERDRKGRIEITRGNLFKALDVPDISGVAVHYDTFFQATYLNGVEFRDTDTTRVAMTLEARGFATGIPKTLMQDCLALYAFDHPRDMAADWVRSLVWDGVPRIDGFLVDFFGSADTPYSRAVARYMFTAMAGRAGGPWVKADMCPIFIGPQGCRKSTGVAALSPDPELVASVELGDLEHDALLPRKIQGKLVVEVAEMAGGTKADIRSLKKFLGEPSDKCNVKYATAMSNWPRRNIMLGTSNVAEVPVDDTGARRWLPVQVCVTRAEIDTVAVAQARDQLWAEGYALFLAGGVDWSAEPLAVDVIAAMHVPSFGEEHIEQWLQAEHLAGGCNGDHPFLMSDVAKGIAERGWGAKRVARTLEREGCVSERRRVEGVQARWWRRK